MIHTILFSYDRAMQLSILLESIEKYDCNKLLEITILYNYSSPEYKKGYDLLVDRYPKACWIEEKNYSSPSTNFNFDFFYWRNPYWWLRKPKLRKNKTNFKQAIIESLKKTDVEHIMFLTDDSLFVREISIPSDRLEEIIEQPTDKSFSLRLGANLSKGIFRRKEDSIQWNVYENDLQTDWGCPFSVDGHVYGKTTLLPIIKKIIFNSPNTMEPNIGCFVSEKQLFAQIAAPLKNALVGFELNRVQQVSLNHNLDISSFELNRYFLQGYTLEIRFDETNEIHFRPEIESVGVRKGEEEYICLYHSKNESL